MRVTLNVCYLLVCLLVDCFSQFGNSESIRNANDLREVLLALKPSDQEAAKVILQKHVKLIEGGLCLRLLSEAERAHQRDDSEKCIFFFELGFEAVVLSGRKDLLKFTHPNWLGGHYYDKGLVKKAI